MSYGSGFYEDLRDGSARSAQVLVPMIRAALPISSVLDVGCGVGVWLAEFVRDGIEDVFGVDLDVPLDSLAIGLEHFCRVDLSNPFSLGRRFDLVVSLEVAEHLPEAAAEVFVANLTRHGNAVLFSAAVPGQGGTHHVNEQWPSYWARLFEAHGFACFDPFRQRCWDDSRVELWYRQNTLLFARGRPAEHLRAVLPYAQAVDLVHPELWKSKPCSSPGTRDILALLPPALLASLRRRALALWGSGRR